MTYRYGQEPGVDSYPSDIEFNHGGHWTDYAPAETRVTAQTAREAAREYVRTGGRPTCIRFGEE